MPGYVGFPYTWHRMYLKVMIGLKTCSPPLFHSEFLNLNLRADVNITPNWQLAVPQRMTALYIPKDIYHCIFAYIINGNVDRSLISALGKLRFT